MSAGDAMGPLARSGSGRPQSVRSTVMCFASLAEYRRPTMQLVVHQLGDDLELIVGHSAGPHSAIRVITEGLPRLRVLRNRFLPKQVVLQLLPVRRVLAAGVLVADLNPRMPQVWMVTIARRILRRPTLLWGHAWPRAGRGSRSEWIRRLLRSLPDGLITYTASQAAELRAMHPGKLVVPAPNAICAAAECRFALGTERDAVTYVGRLVAEKKPLQLIEGFERAWAMEPEMRLVIVGDGDQAPLIADRVARSPARAAIRLLGHVSDRRELEAVYARSFVSVSPGYVGLAITQSFSFGVPMLISRDEPHAPEIEAAVEGLNAVFFRTDDVDALSTGLLGFWSHRSEWASRGVPISSACADSYSVEVMADGVVSAVEAFR